MCPLKTIRRINNYFKINKIDTSFKLNDNLRNREIRFITYYQYSVCYLFGTF